MDLIPFSVSNYSLEWYLVKVSDRSRIIYWIIIVMIVVGMALLPLVNVDVSIQARGYFQSETEKQSVCTPFQGKVVFTSVRNGDRVLKGDTLLIIESETIRAQQSALIQRLAENDSSINDLVRLTRIESGDLLLSDQGLFTKRYRAEFGQIKNQQTIQLQKFLKKQTEHDRNELLYAQKIIPKIEYENSLFALNSEKENLNQIILYQKSLWQNDLTVRRNESIKLLADKEQYKEEIANRIVLAPISGEIIQSSDIQSGSIVNQGESIAEISPEGELVATCFIRPADIGMIHETQKVKIQVDAFNYNEWGTLPADIIYISDDIILENGSSAFFRIKCKPARTTLSLRNGYTAKIKKGMSVNARIVVIRRSLYNLLFDRADKWFNPYTYRKE